MKLMQKLFHWMMNRSWKFQGCSSIDTGTAEDLDIPLLTVTLGTSFETLWVNGGNISGMIWSHYEDGSWWCLGNEARPLHSNSAIYISLHILFLYWSHYESMLYNLLNTYVISWFVCHILNYLLYLKVCVIYRFLSLISSHIISLLVS